MKHADGDRSQKKAIRAIWVALFGVYLFVFGVGGWAHSRWQARAEATGPSSRLQLGAMVVGLVITIAGFAIARHESKTLDKDR